MYRSPGVTAMSIMLWMFPQGSRYLSKVTQVSARHRTVTCNDNGFRLLRSTLTSGEVSLIPLEGAEKMQRVAATTRHLRMLFQLIASMLPI